MKKKPTLIFITFFVITSVLLHYRSFNKPPTSIHAWAQSDHYCLSLGFLENGFDFFHPKTYSLTHQFPPVKELKDPQGITAVDFPILHYCVALLMYILGDSSPWVFRFVSLLWSFFALGFLFGTVQKEKGIGIALFVVGFIAFQPIYCYYQNGFHVSSAALNTLIVGICLMMKYLKYEKYRYFLLAMAFMTLAALMRFTHLISLISLGAMYFILSIKNKRLDKHLWYILGCICIVLGYFVYNQYLALEYGSVFLNKPMVPDSLEVFKYQLLVIVDTYLKGFLPPFHIISLAILISLFLKFNRNKIGYVQKKALWLIFLFIGASTFTLLMTYHLSAHGYYSLDVWMPLIISSILLMITKIDNEILYSRKLKRTGIVLMVGMILFASFIQERRYTKNVEESKTDIVINNFMDSRGFLNSLIPENTKVLIICGSGWNTPMVGWQRNVYRVAWNFSQRIPYELSKKYDFIVTQDLSFKNIVLDNYPDYLSQVHKYKGNGLVTIWKQH